MVFLWQQLTEIRALSDEAKQLDAIDLLLHRSDPGPGGRYLDLGAPGSLRHTTGGQPWESDPGYLTSPFVGYDMAGIARYHTESADPGHTAALPVAQLRQLCTHYTTALTVRLDHLEPSAYTLRVAYGVAPASISLTVNGVPHAPSFCDDVERTCTYAIAAELTAEGGLMLTWCAAPGERGVRVAELWLSPASGHD